ncbi:hypothetical protein POSPLADRAFT_1049903 [Postia placenta MAD-698-R-SB12]|uniref:Uncharacterized protein n=1 Tax=Postia placenta MAD-698-R-SB12 TaxID=670580 RepID=A0A1X6MMM3_9APHY|nr:hypothetical protein POSPLADRAFT_1049903 [Postia placenta MAD-698-R-SB12]OSX57687.1 hypothetical protein POSPLADRAFT_1049903 [Postia placenta MAD-698-R-SB12]
MKASLGLLFGAKIDDRALESQSAPVYQHVKGSAWVLRDEQTRCSNVRARRDRGVRLYDEGDSAAWPGFAPVRCVKGEKFADGSVNHDPENYSDPRVTNWSGEDAATPAPSAPAPDDKEERDKAVQKFLARAELGKSLFSSILAPPPAKRARTIHNPEDPPVPAPTKPRAPSPPPRKAAKSSRGGEGTSKSKSRRGKDGGKGKSRQHANRQTADVDIDMKAAATLTSFLMSSRPSVSASSPRSSISAGSDAGSAHSYAQYAQSSARTITAETSALPETSYGMREATPPPMSPVESDLRQSYPQPSSVREEDKLTPPKSRKRPFPTTGDSGTPHVPSDTEAADSLLFLATSPSPVRAAAAARDGSSKDLSSFRTLSGSSTLKGRVLFPTQGGGDDASSAGSSRALRRDDMGSFTSTASAGSSDFAPEGSFPNVYNRHIGTRPQHTSLDAGLAAAAAQLQRPREPTITPPTPIESMPTQLLPAPPLASATHVPIHAPASAPAPTPAPVSVSIPASEILPAAPARSDLAQLADARASSPPHTDSKRLADAPPTPGNTFDFSDFLNVSPSPATAIQQPSRLIPLDLGRRLFEELQGGQGSDADVAAAVQNGLGAGIDLQRH